MPTLLDNTHTRTPAHTSCIHPLVMQFQDVATRLAETCGCQYCRHNPTPSLAMISPLAVNCLKVVSQVPVNGILCYNCVRLDIMYMKTGAKMLRSP